MKTTYLLGAIVLASFLGLFVPTRWVKSLMFVLTGGLAAYGLWQLLT
jgi:hypothetical protein